MFSLIAAYLRDEEDQDPSFIRLTRNILLFVIFTNIALMPLVTGYIGENSRNPTAFFALLLTLILEVIALIYVLRARVSPAKILVPLSLTIAVAAVSLNSNGLKNSSVVALPVILLIAAVLLGKRAFFLITPLTVAALIVISIVDLSGGIPYVRAGLDDAFIIPILIITGAGISHLLILRLNENIDKARENERKYREENIELVQLRASLEERVQQRTEELETANLANERRARQFQAVAQVMKVISNIQDLESLMPGITNVISDQFNIYHTGIFLLDAKKEYALLRAANSIGGQKMLERGHKLQVGQTGIVGFVAATGQPRIALDVGTDAVFFDNPDLPNTRSEAALPLRYAGQIIGVLDVQSVEANAFNEDDIEVLITLADQVAIAINNAFTIQKARQSLAEAQSALGRSASEAWQVMRPKSIGLGLELRESLVRPLEEPLTGSHIQEAIRKGKTVLTETTDQGTKIAIPIRLRGQIIGVMQINSRKGATLTEDETDIAEAVADRLSLAIESATLLEATQQRANIERVTTDITGRISASTRFETILQTAAQELSRALGGSDVLVQIEPVALELSAENL
ncbi:MAG TPA: GAF domain-containing protein [Anaerolineales bacterium]|nr:GAF domain-containing protein [Anaerolineales bacterium]